MTTTTDTAAPTVEADRRAAYTAGLRALADALDANPELPMPYSGTAASGLLVILGHRDVDQKAALRAYARVFGGPARKGHRDSYYDLTGTIAGLHVHVIADRDQVCERIVTGTREVTRDVPDPEALAAVPTTTVTETVEDVEWVCRPLLADDPVSV